MSNRRKKVDGTVLRFQIRNGKHYPYVRFTTREGRTIERLYRGLAVKDVLREDDAYLFFAAPAGYGIKVRYREEDPEGSFEPLRWIRQPKEEKIIPSPDSISGSEYALAIDPKKKKRYTRKLAALILGDLGAIGLIILFLALDLTYTPWRPVAMFFVVLGLLAYLLLIPVFVIWVRGISLAGTERVFIRDGTVYYYTWESDPDRLSHPSGTKHIYRRVTRVDSVRVRGSIIRVKGEIRRKTSGGPGRRDYRRWDADAEKAVMDKFLALFPNESVGGKRRSLSIRRILADEEHLLNTLEAMRER